MTYELTQVPVSAIGAVFFTLVALVSCAAIAIVKGW
ncbi:hypothetical protein KASHIRA_02160 [Serratia phage vB_SmaM-Kashira]|nr:hypothetical protein KASHIRA_02160 [Serratia phage vB_SmaM-Kashira]